MMRDADDDKTRISTHAPAGGATVQQQLVFVSAQFLLTPLREGRLNAVSGSPTSAMISTHAPAGGATHCLHCHCHRGWYFYSRPCGRGDGCRLHIA